MVLVLHGVPDFLYIFDTEIQERKKFWFCTKYWLLGINGQDYVNLLVLYFEKTGIFAAGAL